MIEKKQTEIRLWDQNEPNDALVDLQVEPEQGLTKDQVTQRREIFGRNEIVNR